MRIDWIVILAATRCREDKSLEGWTHPRDVDSYQTSIYYVTYPQLTTIRTEVGARANHSKDKTGPEDTIRVFATWFALGLF